MRLKVRHTTTYTYDPNAGRVTLRLRLFPSVHDSQTPVDWQVSVNGETVEPDLVNGFGEGEAIWRSAERVEDITIEAGGVVDTVDAAGVVKGLKSKTPASIFLRTSRLTRPDDAIRALAEGLEGGDPLTRLHGLKDTLVERMPYEPGRTTADTTAAEALESGAGVCQDHAHVFIAVARTMGVPARYVAGYMLAGEEDLDRHATHAWAEAYISGLGWVAFDPSNSICPTDRYIRLTCGIDAFDATPIRGNVYAGGTESLNVAVLIEPEAGQQMQQQ